MTRIFASAAIATVTILGATFAAGVAAQAASDRSQLEDTLATSSGQSYTLSELGAAEADRGTVRDNQQIIVHPGIAVAVPGSATISSMPPQVVDQLVESAGLTPAEAANMTLSEVAARKFSRDNSM